MKIILATGIYPPAIGGPATYCRRLAEELSASNEVIVVTYGGKVESGKWKVDNVSSRIPIIRWFLYAIRLRKVGKDADVVYCFSSISCGVPLILSGLTKPKRLLRLGGDFFWERYTDFGGRKSLREWYEKSSWQLAVGSWLLRQFDYIVFSTRFQEEIYENAYRKLPKHSVIENALECRMKNEELKMKEGKKLLFMGRFVRFKNLQNFVSAMKELPDYTLALVGDGPQKSALLTLVDSLRLQDRITFLPPQHGDAKQVLFAEHDMLVIPSLTDISPNVALEAKAAGLRVLITHENGLMELANKMYLHPMNTVDDIVNAINETREKQYNLHDSVSDTITHTWSEVASETLQLFQSLTPNP